MILVSKFMVHRAPPDKTYLSLGLLSHLRTVGSVLTKGARILSCNSQKERLDFLDLDFIVKVNLRNEFNFSNVHGIMNTSGLMQSK